MKLHKLIIIVIIIGAFFLFIGQTAENGIDYESVTPITMNISSPAFQNNTDIPSKYTCDAENTSPELVFSEIPEGTQSLALISHDPDAPREGGWTHWVIINMDPDIGGITENSKPSSGTETTTDFGKPGYGGPCPPSGSHRYFFYLYALDTALSLDASAGKTEVEAAMEGHILETAQLVGLYERQ